jgi:hypothetical protein
MSVVPPTNTPSSLVALQPSMMPETTFVPKPKPQNAVPLDNYSAILPSVSKVKNNIPNYQPVKDQYQNVKSPYKGYLNISDAYGDLQTECTTNYITS